MIVFHVFNRYHPEMTLIEIHEYVQFKYDNLQVIIVIMWFLVRFSLCVMAICLSPLIQKSYGTSSQSLTELLLIDNYL